MNSFYVINLLVYAAVDAMACLGLSQQFGVAGVTNFGFIIFQAAGGYAAAVMALPPDTANGGFQSYLGGWGLPFPLPWIGAAVVGGVIALPFTFLVGRRLRGDFAAVGLLVTAVLLNLLATDYRPLLNGDAGLSLIPQPLQASGAVASAGSQWVFTLIAIALAAAVFWFVRRITESPYGRSLRAMRENDAVADSLGKNLLSLRTGMLVAGGAIAGLSGGVLVTYITTWSPAAWAYAETVVLFAAVIIGGAGNHWGAVLGAVLVPVGFEEVTRYIPTSNNLPPNLIPSLEWVAIGILIVVFLWWRPQGILPERKRVIRLSGGSATAHVPSANPVTGSAPAHVPSAGSAPASVPSAGSAPASVPSAGWQESASAPSVGPEAPEGDGDRGQRDARGPARPPSPRAKDDGARGGPVAASVAGAGGDGSPILEVRGVVREFGGMRAVDEASFVVGRGSLTGLIGPNGAGKSTLLAMLAGTLPVTSGRVVYQGQDVTSLAAFRRARLGLVRTFQLASEFKRLTVMENLLSAVPGSRGDSFHGAVLGKRYWRADEQAAIARAEAVLEQFGLAQYANHYAGDLSGGQRRLVEIMRALMARPSLLLLDEPMAGVHPELAR
ncbi:MAG: ATP-binding cassette domain-containing protein, partial [Actinobacteria bacterium]|nr:ATP-binding cassette domain-containing protein [Actinomycetota bacterium]